MYMYTMCIFYFKKYLFPICSYSARKLSYCIFCFDENTIVRLLLQVSRRLLTFAEFNFFSRIIFVCFYVGLFTFTLFFNCCFTVTVTTPCSDIFDVVYSRFPTKRTVDQSSTIPLRLVIVFSMGLYVPIFAVGLSPSTLCTTQPEGINK